MDINKIYCMDCLEGLKKLPNDSVDLVLTDPPYGISFQSARRTESERFKHIDNDSSPFVSWIDDAFRVLKDGGRLVCFCRWDVQEVFRKAIEESGFVVKSQIVWDREVHGLGDLKGQFAPQHDVAWYATKGRYEFVNGRPRSVIRVSRVSPDKVVHPTEKPVLLNKYLIEKLSSEGDVVLDPFMGSGSTAVACQQLGRRFLGFEISKEYCDVANNRLSQQSLGSFEKKEVLEDAY